VVQTRAGYTNGDCDNSEQSLLSRDSVSETQELEDNEDQVGRRDDRLDNISGMILIKKDQQFKLACTYLTNKLHIYTYPIFFINLRIHACQI
jgi:hypothetical protein